MSGPQSGGWMSCQEDNLGSNESLDSVSSSIKQARAHSLHRHGHGQEHDRLHQHDHERLHRNKANGDNETEYYGIPFMLQKNKLNGQEPPKIMTNNVYSSLPSYSSNSASGQNNKNGNRMFRK